MLNRSANSASNPVVAEINISPLIDIVFLLLIFFMVTAVFVEETGITVQRPSAVSATDLERESILLALTAEGEIVFDGRTIALNRLRGLVARLLRDRKRPVIVIADEAGRTGLLVRVVDECKLAGAERVSLATRRETAP